MYFEDEMLIKFAGDFAGDDKLEVLQPSSDETVDIYYPNENMSREVPAPVHYSSGKCPYLAINVLSFPFSKCFFSVANVSFNNVCGLLFKR